jgi:hypothetical protein
VSGLVAFLLGALVATVILVVLSHFFDLGRDRPPVHGPRDGTPEVVEGPPPPHQSAEGADHRWQPPYLAGRELFEWARSVSRGIVRDVVGEGPGADTPTKLQERIHPGLGKALLPDVAQEERGRTVACPSTGQGTIGVTAPEAIALAEWLRAQLPPEGLTELTEDVTLCDEWIGNGVSSPPCALQGEAHVCMAFGAHPVACRPTLATTLARHMRSESGGPEAVRDFGEAHVDTVARGVIEGMRSGLQRAGLDAKQYELHSALRRALARTDAGEAWARGEDVFEKCRVLGRE